MGKVKIVLVLSIVTMMMMGCGSQANVALDAASNSALQQLYDLQKQLNFKVIVPNVLPHDLRLARIVPELNPNTGKANGAVLLFQSTDQKYSLNVTQTEGNQIGSLGGTEKEVEINGKKGKFGSNDKVTELLWTNGSIVFCIFADPKTEFGSKDTLLQIAKAFK